VLRIYEAPGLIPSTAKERKRGREEERKEGRKEGRKEAGKETEKEIKSLSWKNLYYSQ
jgi:hypothetical protein